MKALKVIVIILVVLAAILFLGGLLLPKGYTISRSTVINAPDSVVYNNVANFNNFLKWNPWSKMEPTQKTSITGTPSQPGHTWEWEGKDTGTGKMELSAVNPYQSIDIDLTFIKPWESKSDVGFTFTPEGNGTKVTWTMSGENESGWQRWMGLMMDSMMDKDFTSGLNSLKELSEKGG